MKVESQIEPATKLKPSEGAVDLRAGMEALAQLSRQSNELDRALDMLADSTGEDTRKSVHRLKQQLSSFEPSVTILGQVKSGKTSLLNAMVGWADLLPSDVNPWTSVVTSVHLRPAEESTDSSARFQFMTADEWDRLTTRGGRIGELAGRAGAESELVKIREQIQAMREKSQQRLGRKFELLMGQSHEYGFFDKNLLERYICLGDEFDFEEGDRVDGQGQFADITKSAELSLSSATVPFRMCLRDTPGVNDTFMMREMVTIQAIRDSRICVVVLSATQALTSVDLALIRLISNLKSRDVIIFVNRADELPDPISQMDEIDHSIRATLKQHDGPEDCEIIFGSAYWANKALSGDIDDMHPASAASLRATAKALSGDTATDRISPDLAWDASGMPELLETLSTRINESLGAPFLTKIASSAVTIATSQQAARSVLVKGEQSASDLTMHAMRSEFEQIVTTNMSALETGIDTIFKEYHERADRAHTNFVERATHSLVAHLENSGAEEIWEYDPSGLRMLLRSSYSRMGSQVRKTANYCYEAAVSDVAELLYRGFGNMVEGIQIAIPEVPDLPAPVALGQTIALDFNDSWWVSWWRRTRGYKAFAKQFRDLISAETEDFMTQMKDVQTNDIRRDVSAQMRDFFDQQRDILSDLTLAVGRNGDVAALFQGAGDQTQSEQLEASLKILRRYAA